MSLKILLSGVIMLSLHPFHALGGAGKFGDEGWVLILYHGKEKLSIYQFSTLISERPSSAPPLPLRVSLFIRKYSSM